MLIQDVVKALGDRIKFVRHIVKFRMQFTHIITKGLKLLRGDEIRMLRPDCVAGLLEEVIKPLTLGRRVKHLSAQLHQLFFLLTYLLAGSGHHTGIFKRVDCIYCHARNSVVARLAMWHRRLEVDTRLPGSRVHAVMQAKLRRVRLG